MRARRAVKRLVTGHISHITSESTLGRDPTNVRNVGKPSQHPQTFITMHKFMIERFPLSIKNVEKNYSKFYQLTEHLIRKSEQKPFEWKEC